MYKCMPMALGLNRYVSLSNKLRSLIVQQGIISGVAIRNVSNTSKYKQKPGLNAKPLEIKNICVIGGGLMGSGIAQVAAQNNFNVTVVDEGDEFLQRCMVSIRKSLDRITRKKFPNEPKGASKFIDDTLSKVKTSRNPEKAVEDADLVIEAITENLESKHILFKKLDVAAPERTLFASNTSSLAIGDISSVTEREDRFGGLHFFNPVPMMALVEVVKGPHTSDLSFQALFQFAKDLGKSPVVCKDTPGFIVNRLLIPYMMEAVRLMERGHASAQDIDTAMKLGAGYPMGPFELIDYVGLDTTKYIIDGWREKFPGNSLFINSPTVDRLVEEDKLGRKKGEGFYSYKNGK